MKKWLIFLIVLITLWLFSESTFFHFTYFKSTWDSTSNFQSNCTTTQSRYNNTFNPYLIDLDEVKELGIIYQGLEEVKESYSRNTNIVVEISAPDFSSWKYYIPFYKYITINHKFDYKYDANIRQNGERKQVSCRGTVSIDGYRKIIGICSGRLAKSLVQDKIYQEVKTKIHEGIQEQIELEE